MRFLAIDLGDRRTGLAAGDDITGVVVPLRVLAVPTGPALMDALVEAVRLDGPDAVVVGLPLNMDGTDGPRAIASRVFGAELSERTGVPVEYQDERLTSHAADKALAGSGLSPKRKKKLQDAIAAAEILRDFLATR